MFNIIPENFFVPLSSPNKLLYWECIDKLYSAMSNQLSFGIEREIMVDELQFYFDSNYSFEIKVEDGEDTKGKTSRDKANWVLRRLEYYNWIEIETTKNYVQKINFKDYAVKIIKTLIDIKNKKNVEYQGYIYTISSILKDENYSPGTQLLSIKENLENLMLGLKNLNSSIKSYTENLASKGTKDILDSIFNDYMVNVVDKAYHRLFTSDCLSKYRLDIVIKLKNKLYNPTYIDIAAKEIAEIEEITLTESQDKVKEYISSFIDIFDSLECLLEDIQKRHSQYLKAAQNRVKFDLIGNDDIKGQLKEILLSINEEMESDNLELNGVYKLEFIKDLINISSISFLDEHSLKAPIEGKKEFKPKATKRRKIDKEKRKENLENFKRKQSKEIGEDKVNEYILKQLDFNNKDEILASCLPMETTLDYFYLIFIRLYANRKFMKYAIEPIDKEIKINDFRFKDFKIKRRISNV